MLCGNSVLSVAAFAGQDHDKARFSLVRYWHFAGLLLQAHHRESGELRSATAISIDANSPAQASLEGGTRRLTKSVFLKGKAKERKANSFPPGEWRSYLR
jgi:hypothetical protein